jgi:hypothetical protein
MEKTKYTFKEKLEIMESITTIIMFLMAIWGTVTAYEKGFWHKINHIINYYHETITKKENELKIPEKISKNISENKDSKKEER